MGMFNGDGHLFDTCYSKFTCTDGFCSCILGMDPTSIHSMCTDPIFLDIMRDDKENYIQYNCTMLRVQTKFAFILSLLTLAHKW